MKILVTGAAGFIGMHVSRLLLERGDIVVGVDNLNDYYPRIMVAVFTIGIIGFALDRLMFAIQSIFTFSNQR